MRRKLGIELTGEARQNLEHRIGQRLNSREREKRSGVDFPEDFAAAEAEVRRLTLPTVPTPKRNRVVLTYLSTVLRNL